MGEIGEVLCHTRCSSETNIRALDIIPRSLRTCLEKFEASIRVTAFFYVLPSRGCASLPSPACLLKLGDCSWI